MYIIVIQDESSEDNDFYNDSDNDNDNNNNNNNNNNNDYDNNYDDDESNDINRKMLEKINQIETLKSKIDNLRHKVSLIYQ